MGGGGWGLICDCNTFVGQPLVILFLRLLLVFMRHAKI